MRSLIGVVFLGALALAADAPRIEVGDEAVRGEALQPFQATWKVAARQDGEWAVTSMITETLTVREVGGRKAYHRKQVTSNPDGESVSVAEVAFAADTLEPLMSVMKRGGETHWNLEFSLSGDATKVEGKARLAQNGTLEEIDRQTQSPSFDGAVLGLILATLPLEEGYRAELPAMWIASAAEYEITARVTGRREFPDGRGGHLEAWAVEVDWADLNSDRFFQGGDDGSGGTYYVVPEPPDGYPHVPAYINSSARIELMR